MAKIIMSNEILDKPEMEVHTTQNKKRPQRWAYLAAKMGVERKDLVKITQKDIIKTMAKHFYFPEKELERVVKMFFYHVIENVNAGKLVQIPHYGYFFKQFFKSPKNIKTFRNLMEGGVPLTKILPGKYKLVFQSSFRPDLLLNDLDVHNVYTSKFTYENMIKARKKHAEAGMALYDNPLGEYGEWIGYGKKEKPFLFTCDPWIERYRDLIDADYYNTGDVESSENDSSCGQGAQEEK